VYVGVLLLVNRHTVLSLQGCRRYDWFAGWESAMLAGIGR